MLLTELTVEHPCRARRRAAVPSCSRSPLSSCCVVLLTELTVEHPCRARRRAAVPSCSRSPLSSCCVVLHRHPPRGEQLPGQDRDRHVLLCRAAVASFCAELTVEHRALLAVELPRRAGCVVLLAELTVERPCRCGVVLLAELTVELLCRAAQRVHCRAPVPCSPCAACGAHCRTPAPSFCAELTVEHRALLAVELPCCAARGAHCRATASSWLCAVAQRAHCRAPVPCCCAELTAEHPRPPCRVRRRAVELPRRAAASFRAGPSSCPFSCCVSSSLSR